jgi:hypothetical protein
MTQKDENTNELTGTALAVYRLLLTSSKPLGIRETQRTLGLSSPSVAQYHLTKLESLGLVKKVDGNYVVDTVILQNCVRISNRLFPKYLFYSLFGFLALIGQLFLFRPAILTQSYFFSVLVTVAFLSFFCYETLNVWLKRTL